MSGRAKRENTSAARHRASVWNMSWERPSASKVWEAIDAYIASVYGEAGAPAAVRGRLETLRAMSSESFFESSVFERDDKALPTRYSIRLGNPHYPHMKLVIERSPDGRGHLFRADTHDRHIRPAPESREYQAFTALMQQNQRSAEQVEAEWARRGLPTFKEYLRQDLARRAQHSSPPR
jgi:hypothetical protein